MKIRNGFVSNSSSSSFVIGKAYMTEEQIKIFKSKINDLEDEEYEDENYITESKYYFQGSVSNHCEMIDIVIAELGLENFASYC